MNRAWKIKKLGDICQSDLGKTLNQSKDTGKLYPYLCAINIQWDRVDLSTLKQTRFEENETDRYSVRKGDLLVCEGGDIGRAAIWEKDEIIRYQNALHRIRFTDSMMPRFCLYYLRFLKNQGVLDSRYGKGVTIKHLVKSALLSIPIPVPPIEEQFRLVEELDLLTGIIDRKNAQLHDLDALAQSIFYEMFGDPVFNERGWEYRRLDEVAQIIGGATPKTQNAEYWSGSNYWVTPAELHGDRYQGATERTISDEAVRKTNVSLLPVGTVLLSSRAPIGKVAITTIPMYCNQGFKNLICSAALNNEYACQALKCKKDYLNSLGTGATFKEISKKTTEAIMLAIPPIKLQEEFAAKVRAIELQKELVGASLRDSQDLLNNRMSVLFE